MSAKELHIDLGALSQNLRAVRKEIAPSRHMFVVKSEAYGQGLERVVEVADAEGIEWFGAFDLDTALRTRAIAKPSARIFAWAVYSDEEIDRALAADIDLGVGSLGLLERTISRAEATGHTARVHLKVDTGLRRDGIHPDEWAEAADRARRAQSAGTVQIAGVWSHIAEASDHEDDLAREEFIAAVTELGEPGAIRHLAASAAAFARPEFRFDMARVGAFGYGIRSAGGPADDQLGVRPVATLFAPITHIVEDAVTIGVGSLDGLDSRLSGKLEIDTPAGPRVARRIEHAQTIVDAWPGATIGDSIAVLGGQARLSATDAAELIDTVGEEILLRISPAIPRVYKR